MSVELHDTKPALVTESELGKGYLCLQMTMKDDITAFINMEVKAMKMLGAMMMEVARRVEIRDGFDD